jgi:hypothetical protein
MTIEVKDDLVTEEMVVAAMLAYDSYGTQASRDAVRAALLDVAPMIAAREREGLLLREIKIRAAARALIKAADRINELEALLREAEKWIPDTMESKSGRMCGPTVKLKAKIAAAIRARGETPTKAPGEIDWSAMDKD